MYFSAHHSTFPWTLGDGAAASPSFQPALRRNHFARRDAAAGASGFPLSHLVGRGGSGPDHADLNLIAGKTCTGAERKEKSLCYESSFTEDIVEWKHAAGVPARRAPLFFRVKCEE